MLTYQAITEHFLPLRHLHNAKPRRMSWGRFSLNEIKDWTLYTYYLIEPVVTRLFDHSKLSQSKLGNPSSFSRSQTELGSILQMNKTKRNEGREKKLKFKSQYKNTFIFDWQNEKKSISYMSYGLNLKYLKVHAVGPSKVSKNIPKWLEPRPNLLICLYNICVI